MYIILFYFTFCVSFDGMLIKHAKIVARQLVKTTTALHHLLLHLLLQQAAHRQVTMKVKITTAMTMQNVAKQQYKAITSIRNAMSHVAVLKAAGDSKTGKED